MTLANGSIALILGHGDHEAKKEFTASADYALKMLDAPGRRGGGIARSYEAHVQYSEEGARLTALHEKRPEPGSERLSITDYHQALLCVVSFGARESFATIAAYPEERYSNPGTVASEDHWLYLRAWKALLAGNEADALHVAEASLTKAPKDLRPARTTLISLVHRDQAAFSKSLQDELVGHKKRYRKEPNAPLGVISLPALAVCRMAIERGMTVEDQPYVPVRLLPNYGGAAVH